MLRRLHRGLGVSVVGQRKKVPTRSGKWKTYVNFDNAASTPALTPVARKCSEFLNWYSSVHRGAGFKSQVATTAYDDAHRSVLRFFSADEDKNTVIFGKNTTEAINKLSYRLQLKPDDIVLTTLMEHHSNELPWRGKARVKHVQVTKNGCLDLEDLQRKLQLYAPKVRLLAVTGASNVTGIVNDISHLAEIAHRYGARILVDAAQLAPHRPINVQPDDAPDHIDFLALSAHKMYAPYGTGALIGPKSVFESGDPEYVGGGTVRLVTRSRVEWTHLPDREEAGSPNVVGAVALAAAMNYLNRIGMDKVAAHESRLTSRLLSGLKAIDGIEIYGPQSADPAARLGVVSFNVGDLPHALVAAALAWEGAVGVRNGCFCARPYIHSLLNLTVRDINRIDLKIRAGESVELPGMVRISFGVYNTGKEVDIALKVLKNLAQNPDRYRALYRRQADGSYLPRGMRPDYRRYFSL